MTDEERDDRLETLTDAIAETNRNVNALTADVDQLLRTVAELAAAVGELTQFSARTSTQLRTLTRLVHLHLHLDHDYHELGDSDDD